MLYMRTPGEKILGRFLRKRGTFLHFSDILYPAKEHRPLDLARKDAMILHETYLKNPEFANIQKISGKLLGGKIFFQNKGALLYFLSGLLCLWRGTIPY